MLLSDLKSKYSAQKNNPNKIKTLFTGSNFINSTVIINCDISHQTLVRISYFDYNQFGFNEISIYLEKTKHLTSLSTFDELCFLYKNHILDVLGIENKNTIEDIPK
jgi:hypothetical protein